MKQILILISSMGCALPLSAMENTALYDIQQKQRQLALTRANQAKEIPTLALAALARKTDELFGKDTFPKEIRILISQYHFRIARSLKHPSVEEIYAQSYKARFLRIADILDLDIKIMKEFTENAAELAQYCAKSFSHPALDRALDQGRQTSPEILRALEETKSKIQEATELEDVNSPREWLESLLESLRNEMEGKVQILFNIKPVVITFLNQPNITHPSMILEPLNSFDKLSFFKSDHRSSYWKDHPAFSFAITCENSIIWTGDIPYNMKRYKFFETKVTFDRWPSPERVEQVEYYYHNDMYESFSLKIDLPAMGFDQSETYLITDTELWSKKGIPESYSPQEERIRTIRGDTTPFYWGIRKQPTPDDEGMSPETKDLILEQYREISTDKSLSEDDKYTYMAETMGITKEDINAALGRKL